VRAAVPNKSLAERPTHLQTKTTALAIYDAAYSVDRWAPALGSHTFRTLVRALSWAQSLSLSLCVCCVRRGAAQRFTRLTRRRGAA
jgi:hypothetical protein